MPGDCPDRRPECEVPEDTLLLLNRATVVRHLVRTAVHELNNAMQMVSGSAEMLATIPDLPPRAAVRVEAILRHLGRCRSVVDGLSATARAVVPGTPAVDVRAATEQVLEMRRYEHTRAGYDVALSGGGLPGGRVARVDPNDLREMLLSLLLNAEQALAGRAGGVITARLEQDGDAILVVLQDNGPGLPPDLGDPFAPFTTTRAAAAGLGLYAARALAARHGAALDVRSRPGEGTTATLRLPGASS